MPVLSKMHEIIFETVRGFMPKFFAISSLVKPFFTLINISVSRFVSISVKDDVLKTFHLPVSLKNEARLTDTIGWSSI